MLGEVAFNLCLPIFSNHCKNMIRSAVVIVLAVGALAYVLSLTASVPYIFTFCSVAAFLVCMRLVTLDDDYPGGWSNMDGDREIWQRSLKELAMKVAVFIFLLLTALGVPTVSKFGS